MRIIAWESARASVLGLLAALALAAPAADAAPKRGAFFFGGSGTTGGLFNQPRDVASNETGAGAGDPGDIYVVDDVNNRVQRFSVTGAFVSAWGADVSAPAGGNDYEICVVAADCKAGVAVGGNGAVAGNGALDNPQSITVDQDTGLVYVSDRDNRRINVYDGAGDFLRAFGFNVVASGPGELGTGYEVCVDANADVCRAGVGANNGPAGQYSAGTTVNGYRIAVSPPDSVAGTGSVYLANTGSRRVEVYGLDGSAPASFGTTTDFASNFPLHVAVDGNGVVYANDGTGSTHPLGVGGGVRRFDTASGNAVLPPITAPPLASNTGGTLGLETDNVDGRLMVGRGVNPVTRVHELDIDTLDEIDGHLVGSGLAGLGIGVDGTRSRLYLATTTSSHRVLVLDETGAPPAETIVSPPSSIGASTATFHATITPDGPTGIATSYRFQYSETGQDDDWHDVAAPASVGDGANPVEVNSAVTGLEANTLYRVRVVTSKAFGNVEVVSPELTFLTDKVPPSVTTGAAQNRTATSAQLVGRINPNNLATTYRFEYGKTAGLGSSIPVPDASAGAGGVERPVLQTLEGLDSDRTYHYRLVATNFDLDGDEFGTTAGDIRTFRTRPAPAGAPGASRAYEMVTPPDKNNRRGSDSADPGVEEGLVNPGLPTPDGEAVLFRLGFGILDPEAGTAFPHRADWVVIRRGEDRWSGESVHNIPAATGAASALDNLQAVSADLETQAWHHRSQLFPVSRSKFGTRVFGDSGGLDGSGWYEWISDPLLAAANPSATDDSALIGDDGGAMVRWGNYRGLLAPQDPSAAAAASGQAAYYQAPPGSGSRELVNECTGTGTGATEIPLRNENATPFDIGDPMTNAPALLDDKIDAQPCEEGSLVSLRGAVIGARAPGSSGQTVTGGALSEDGARTFFTAPDPGTSLTPYTGIVPAGTGIGRDICGGLAATPALEFKAYLGAETECPPQLYIRQYDSDGTPTVRWLSRTEVTVANGAPAEQSIDLLGPAVFEGASDDGGVVYFRTNSPLTADDRNATASAPVTAGTPSNNSWDLYRYELPGDRDVAPDGGELTRVTGGPGATSDPNVNSSNGTALRFLSADGDRAYVATRAPLDVGADAQPGTDDDPWNTPPTDGVTTATGTVSNNLTRNLYLYDHGAGTWKFIAQLPFSDPAGSGDVNRCASSAGPTGYPQSSGTNGEVGRATVNCVRGTPSGDAIVFETKGQLTPDDNDTAGDIYLYDADADELTRISAPPPSETGYACKQDLTFNPVELCNADLGFGRLAERVGRGGVAHSNLAADENGDLEAVYFESRLPLVPADQNDRRMDVYEWKDGELSLISPGTADDDAYFSGNSTDGEDVFFLTSQRIDPREIDEEDFDLYDARRDGGFPLPEPKEICSALTGACQGSGSDRVAIAPRTPSGGGGDVEAGDRRVLALKAPGRKAAARAARTGVVRLRVRANASGPLLVVAQARMPEAGGGRELETVGRRRIRLRKAGSALVSLRLSPAAVRELRTGRSLRLVIRARASGARTRTVSLVLKRRAAR